MEVIAITEMLTENQNPMLVDNNHDLLHWQGFVHQCLHAEYSHSLQKIVNEVVLISNINKVDTM